MKENRNRALDKQANELRQVRLFSFVCVCLAKPLNNVLLTHFVRRLAKNQLTSIDSRSFEPSVK